MTQSTVDAAPPPPALSPPRRRRWWGVVGTVLLAGIGSVIVAANFVHVPYTIISPGDATALDEHVVTVSGTSTYRHRGDFLFLTVQLSNADPTLWRYLFAQLDSDVTIEKRENVIGCVSYGDSGKLNDLLMVQSQNVAKTVALERLGYSVPETGPARILVVDVACKGPAFGRSHLLDQITGVDGTPVSSNDQIAPLVQQHHPGERVRLSIVRDGKTRELTVKTGATTGNPADPCSLSTRHLAPDAKACVGVATQTFRDQKFPVAITIDTMRVSGPSAGLAFTLAIIDDLTPGNLTGGKKIAVTGAIAPDGTVFEVGGVEQKAIAASRAGATVMLVPASEAPLAREHANGMKIIPVKTLDDALKALRRAGGDPVPAKPAQTPAQ